MVSGRSLFDYITLRAASGRVWQQALNRNLDEQNLYNNAVGDLIKGVLRFGGWLALDVLTYGGSKLLSF